MSHFINRLNAKGYFAAGGAQFAVKKAEGAFIHCVQTHKNDGSLLSGFDLTFDADGVLDISQAETVVPASFVIPQNHPVAFTAVKAEFADLDNQQVTFCAACEAAGVTLGDSGDACVACATNIATISHLKSLV